ARAWFRLSRCRGAEWLYRSTNGTHRLLRPVTNELPSRLDPGEHLARCRRVGGGDYFSYSRRHQRRGSYQTILLGLCFTLGQISGQIPAVALSKATPRPIRSPR